MCIRVDVGSVGLFSMDDSTAWVSAVDVDSWLEYLCICSHLDVLSSGSVLEVERCLHLGVCCSLYFFGGLDGLSLECAADVRQPRHRWISTSWPREDVGLFSWSLLSVDVGLVLEF